MKKIFIFSTLAAAFAMTSCDNIDQEERFIPVEVNKSEKVVLLEDYTGNTCVNCPLAAEIIENIHEIYGDNFIAVGLHPASGPYQQPIKISGVNCVDMRSNVADAYYKKYSVKAFPTAMIDRMAFDGSKLLDNKDKWSGYVNERMQTSTPVNISMTSGYNPTSRELTIDTDIAFSEAVGEQLSLQLWVIENNIISPQVTPKGMEKEYVHNHVLRDAINGYWGETLGMSFNQNQRLSKSYTYTLKADWNDNNCQVVGFVYRNSTDEILQAHLVDIVSNNAEQQPKE